MKQIKSVYYFGIAIIGLLILTLPVKSDGEELSKTQVFTKLRSSSQKKQMLAFTELKNDRKEICHELLKIIQDENTKPEIKEYAIKLVGEYRAIEGIDTLMENILFVTRQPIMERVPEILYPAVGALCKIGNPVPSKIIEKLEINNDERILSLYALIIRNIDGLDIGLKRIEFASEKSRNPEAKSNLIILKKHMFY